MVARIALVAVLLGSAGALVPWRFGIARAQEIPAEPPVLASPFPAGQAWLVTCGYTLPEQSKGGGCGHSGTLWNRYALDFQLLGGPSAAMGQPVLAAAEGSVRFAGRRAGLGWHVVVDHGAGYSTLYAHLLAAPVVRTGEAVRTGELLGRVGCTGRCTGAHLHFALWRNGVSVLPEPICGQRGFRPGRVLVGCARAELTYADLLRLGVHQPDPLTPALADFDGDGAPEAALMYAAKDGLKVHVLSSRGRGLRARAYPLEQAQPGGMPRGLPVDTLAGDFDGDGRTDIAGVERTGECDLRVRVYLAGDARFAEAGPDPWWRNEGAPSARRFCATNLLHTVAGDYNGDGRADLALLLEPEQGVLDLRVLLSNGVRLLSSPEPWWRGRTDRTGPVFWLLPGDFNDDGRTDLAAFGPATFGCESQVRVFLSTGAGFARRRLERWWHDRATCAHRVTQAAAGDFDGDGAVDDLALLQQEPPYFRRIDVLVKEGGRFERTLLPWWHELVLYPPTQVRALLPADLNGDGRSDLVLLHDEGDCPLSGRALFSSGERFTQSRTWSPTRYCATDVVAAVP